MRDGGRDFRQVSDGCDVRRRDVCRGAVRIVRFAWWRRYSTRTGKVCRGSIRLPIFGGIKQRKSMGQFLRDFRKKTSCMVGVGHVMIPFMWSEPGLLGFWGCVSVCIGWLWRCSILPTLSMWLKSQDNLCRSKNTSEHRNWYYSKHSHFRKANVKAFFLKADWVPW